MARGNGNNPTGDDAGGFERPFRPRLSRARGERPQSFIGRINKAVAKARAASGRKRNAKPSGRFNARGRGAKIAPGLKGKSAWTTEGGMRFRARRVIVKARVVKLKGVGAQAAAHLRYLEREGAGTGAQNRDYDEKLAGVNPELAGSKRPQNGGMAGGWRAGETGNNPVSSAVYPDTDENPPERASGAEKPPASYVNGVVSAA